MYIHVLLSWTPQLPVDPGSTLTSETNFFRNNNYCVTSGYIYVYVCTYKVPYKLTDTMQVQEHSLECFNVLINFE